MQSLLLSSTLAILRQLIGFDTTSRNSNLKLIEYIRSYLETYGITSHLIPHKDGHKASLIATIGKHHSGGYLLSGHTDVVPVDGQQWSSNPFTLTQRESRLYGRGTCDMKSFIAVCLALAPHWQKLPLKKSIHLAFSYDEEVGCIGTPDLAQFIAQQKLEPALAIIGEPTEMKVVSAHKGMFAFETVVRGHEAHSSLPHKGVNAVMIACELVEYLHKLAEEYRVRPTQDNRFDPPYTTLHVGVIHGGTARNIIPGECRFLWEIRPLPGEDVQAIIQRFQNFVQTLEDKMHLIAPLTGITTSPISQVGAMELTQYSHPTEDEVLAITGANQLHAVSFFTEAGIFQQYGIPCIICGPGSVAQAHKPDEFVEIDQVQQCIAFLQRLENTLT